MTASATTAFEEPSTRGLFARAPAVQQERNLEALCRYDGSIPTRAENSLLEEAGKLVGALSPGVSRIGRSEPDTGCRCRGAWHGSGSGSRRRSEPPIEVWAVSHRRGTRLSPEASGTLAGGLVRHRLGRAARADLTRHVQAPRPGLAAGWTPSTTVSSSSASRVRLAFCPTIASNDLQHPEVTWSWTPTV